MERERRPIGNDEEGGAFADDAARVSEIERGLARLQSSLEALKRRDVRNVAKADANQVEIYAEAVETFGSADKATLWLNRPTTVFEGRAPVEILGEEDGARRVRIVLGRIAHGLFA